MTENLTATDQFSTEFYITDYISHTFHLFSSKLKGHALLNVKKKKILNDTTVCDLFWDKAVYQKNKLPMYIKH